ncbi:MAG: lipoyl synthase [Legionellales bacterium]|nr:lipoyl synthase [Legionellales bacterium]|tara:strand:+ start:138 stop:1061 length:924 start_codon:yes stop_codon:yes gene_type:complete
MNKQRGQDKLSRIPIKVESKPKLKKPEWLKIKLPPQEAMVALKKKLRQMKLVTVCEEAQCPNLPECFSKGTASFMIMGDKCTRRCSFCDVAHGRPNALDLGEPIRLAQTIHAMGLKHVVITSVDRDDLRDGGASHFASCIQSLRQINQSVIIEILVPDFRGRLELALRNLISTPVDVFNHNIETVPRIYKAARPGSDYQHSLNLLKQYKSQHPNTPTKSGIMVGLGETDQEVEEVLHDLRQHDVDMVTIGQYLQPSEHHYPVMRYVTPKQFATFETIGLKLGFKNVASGPFVRSSYHADQQAEALHE